MPAEVVDAFIILNIGVVFMLAYGYSVRQASQDSRCRLLEATRECLEAKRGLRRVLEDGRELYISLSQKLPEAFIHERQWLQRRIHEITLEMQELDLEIQALVREEQQLNP